MQSGDIRDSILSNIGLGINSFYWANSKINNQSDSTLKIEELRELASIKLANAELQYNNNSFSEFIFNEIDFEPIFLFGMIIKYNYDAFSNSRSYFEEGLDYEYYENMLLASDNTLKYSDKLIDYEDFIFNYDSNVDIETIYLVRAQTYLRIGEYGSAEAEYLKFGSSECLENNGIIQCLSTFE